MLQRCLILPLFAFATYCHFVKLINFLSGAAAELLNGTCSYGYLPPEGSGAVVITLKVRSEPGSEMVYLIDEQQLL